MKKISLVVLTTAALCACGKSSNIDTKTVLNGMFAECEVVVAKGNSGDTVVKCPVTEQLKAISGAQKNSAFLTGEVATWTADTSAIYVDIESESCIRILGQGLTISEGENYAVRVCVSQAEPTEAK